jgi:hypothetical protein
VVSGQLSVASGQSLVDSPEGNSPKGNSPKGNSPKEISPEGNSPKGKVQCLKE